MRRRRAGASPAIAVAIAVVVTVSIPAAGARGFTRASCPFDARTAVTPVRGRIVVRFAAPACPRCAGRRGLTVETRPGARVVATSPGRVTFAGQVGGVLWVVQQVAPGVRVTYGRLASIAAGVAAGTDLGSGQEVGVAAGRVHLGVRLGERYVDPSRCWRGAPRLVPVPGVEARGRRR